MVEQDCPNRKETGVVFAIQDDNQNTEGVVPFDAI